MAVNNFHLQSIQQQHQSLTSFFFPLDHNNSPLLSQFPDFDSFVYQRGPRYEAYADLRESKLRAKRKIQPTPERKHPQEDYVERSILTPKKEVKFQRNFTTLPKRAKGCSSLAQSVPDFSAVLRKENRKPSSPLPPVAEKAATPPAGLKNGRFFGVVGKVGGSKSVNSGEKRGGSLMARKSCANIEELKGLASIARGAINGETKGGVTTRASARNVLRYSRQF